MLMEGFSMVFGDPLSIVLVAAGTLIGTIFGAIPGLTATMHQMDIIIGVLFALIALFLVLGVTHTSFFGLFGG